MPQIPDFIFQFHKRGGHEVTYVAITTEIGATSYYQYQSIDEYWYVTKAVRAGAVTTYTFTKPVTTDAAAGWLGRAGLDYTTLPLAFGG